jgi:hypothetical protein
MVNPIAVGEWRMKLKENHNFFWLYICDIEPSATVFIFPATASTGREKLKRERAAENVFVAFSKIRSLASLSAGLLRCDVFVASRGCFALLMKRSQ